jgi:hypothetical protein
MDIKDHYTKTFLSAAGWPADEEIIKQHRPLWWYNVRSKGAGGLRLTKPAIDFIEKRAEIKTYKIKFPQNLSITPQILVWLDNFIESPYYITKKYIIVMREKAAFELYLFSGDVKKMGYTKAMSKRLNQECHSPA